VPTYERKVLEDLLDGELPFYSAHSIMSSYKDADRFEKMISILQDRVEWKDRILLPYGENLFIVEKPDGAHNVRCTCGHDYGSYKQNWKLSALIHVRNTQEKLDEVYPRMMSSDPEWMEIREFYCPSCARQLEVEAVPPGYPIIFDFEPDLEGFYRDWLGKPLPKAVSK